MNRLNFSIVTRDAPAMLSSVRAKIRAGNSRLDIALELRIKGRGGGGEGNNFPVAMNELRGVINRASLGPFEGASQRADELPICKDRIGKLRQTRRKDSGISSSEYRKYR